MKIIASISRINNGKNLMNDKNKLNNKKFYENLCCNKGITKGFTKTYK